MNDYRKQMHDAARLYNRSAELIQSLQYEWDSKPSKCVDAFNTLWEDVKQFVQDSDFERSVPSIDTSFLGSLFGLSRCNVKELRDRVIMLQGYIRDYIAFRYPDLACLNWPQYQRLPEMEQQINKLQQRNRTLENDLAETRHRFDQLNEMYSALKTPSQLDLPQEVVDKLNPLERTRLLEAVQAYRVSAWTPAAAVCGMILEGRLQGLCKENGISPGGIGSMIARLGEAGLLKGYYQKLAQVGEFFRHRASHPTSEEFDREKTTLLLTSLIVLIRDVF